MAYQPLTSQEQGLFDEDTDDKFTSNSLTKLDKRSGPKLLVILLGVVVLVELGIIYQRSLIVCMKCTEVDKWNVSYSPASEAVIHEIQTHYGNAGNNTSPFWGPPSPEIDRKWAAISSYGFSKIPKHQAALLPNKTAPIPGDEKNYIVALDLFHEIHCLNMIRQALYPDQYPNMRMNTTYGDWHIRHCVDSIRQSLMCSSDISVIVWQWNSTAQQHFPKGNIAHTCRNFGMIQEWARKRVLDFDQEFDYTVHLEDDIVVPIYHST